MAESTNNPAAPAQPEATPEAQPPRPEPQDEIFTTEHTALIGGRPLAYNATSGRMVVKDEEGKAKAVLFFVAYTCLQSAEAGPRPLTISFNGGPGSSSVWLHLGLLGPRRVLAGDAGAPLPPPYQLADNDYSLLDVTDLVFIDPVGTGFSRPAPGEEAKQFHGVEQDVASVGKFIRLYVTRYRRWSSPKFLIGESYGTTRAAALAGHLQEQYGLYLNGLMLVSVVLNFQTLEFLPGNDLPYILYVPVYAATAWHHRRLADDLQADLAAALRAAEAFAYGDYMQALFQGDTLPAEQRASVVAQLARFTGLSPAYVERSNLRVELMRFCKELLRDERRTVGRLDSRFAGADRDAVGETISYDPSMAATLGPYAGAFNSYVREELGFASDLPYTVLARLYESWDYSKHQNKFLDMSESLRAAMTQNPFLRVIIANGYFDLATPYSATEYTVNHLALEPALRSNLQMTYYEAGHMMYVHEPSLRRLADDLRAFVTGALPEG